MVSAALDVAKKPVVKQNEKEATRNKITHWQKPSEHVDITKVKHARREQGEKSIGKGIYVTCYPDTFVGFVWSLNNIMILIASLSLQRDAKHEASILIACEQAHL